MTGPDFLGKCLTEIRLRNLFGPPIPGPQPEKDYGPTKDYCVNSDDPGKDQGRGSRPYDHQNT